MSSLDDYGALVHDVRERASPVAPVPPKPPSGSSGFPQHRQRSRFATVRRQQAGQDESQARSDIDAENRRRLASMSSAEIDRERTELMESMAPSLLERFLRRAQIDDDSHEVQSRDGTQRPAVVARDGEEASTSAQYEPPPFQIHFPVPSSSTSPSLKSPFRPGAMPDLDPTAPTFLADLQTHYFPNISHDVSALSWLQQEQQPSSLSAYDSSSTVSAVTPSDVRFSFLGTVLPPRTSLSLPTTLGLHHHGKDPEAAGYTVPELAILARSSFPAQRCLAYQLIGRVLFRLGKGQFGQRGSPLVDGLWNVIEKEGIVANMLAEADASKSRGGAQESLDTPSFGRHASAAAWAVEGVWLWRIGGGGDRGLLQQGELRSQ